MPTERNAKERHVTWNATEVECNTPRAMWEVETRTAVDQTKDMRNSCTSTFHSHDKTWCGCRCDPTPTQRTHHPRMVVVGVRTCCFVSSPPRDDGTRAWFHAIPSNYTVSMPHAVRLVERQDQPVPKDEHHHQPSHVSTSVEDTRTNPTMKRTSDGTNKTKRKEEKQTKLIDAFRNKTEVRSPPKNEGCVAWNEDPTDEGRKNAKKLFDPYWTETFNIVLSESEREKKWHLEGEKFDEALEEKTTRGKRTLKQGGNAYTEERMDGGPTNADKNQDQTKYVTMVRKLVDAGNIPPAAEYDRMLELLAQCRGEEDVHLAAELYVLLASLQRSLPPIRRSKHPSGITVNTLAWAPVDGIARGKMCGCEEEHMKKQGIVEEWERMSQLLRDVAQLLENQQRRLDGKILVFKHYVNVLAHDMDVRVTTQSSKKDKSYKPYQESMLWRLLSNAKPVGKGSVREAIECLVTIMVGGTESKLGTTSQELERSGGLDDPSMAMVSLTDPRALGRQAGVLLGAILHILSQAEYWEKKKGIRILRYQRLEADGTLLELFRTKLDSFESKSQFLTYLCGQGQKRRFIGSLFSFGANKKVADKVAPTLTVASAASTYEHIPVETQHIFSYTAADVGRAVKFTGGVDLLMLLLSHLMQTDVEEEGPREEVIGAFQAAREAVVAHSGCHSTARNVLSSQGQVFCWIAGQCANIACSS